MFLTLGIDSSSELCTGPLINVLFTTSSDGRIANEVHVHSWKREVGTTELAPNINGELISTSGAHPIAGNRIKTASEGGDMWLAEGW